MSQTSYEIVVKAVAWFAGLDQVRRRATDEADAQLAESIRRHGVLQPLGARPDGTLVWGHRRLRCATAAGLTEVPVAVLHRDMTEGECLTLQMVENVQRADLCPFDVWQGCVRLLGANPGWQAQDLARALAVSPSMVTRWLSPSRCSPAWQDALQAGAVGISDCYAASKLPEPEQGGLLALKLAGASRDELESAVRKRRATSPASAVRLSRVRCPLGTGATVTVSGPGMTLSEYLDALNLAREAALRAGRESLDIRTAEKVWRDKARAAAEPRDG